MGWPACTGRCSSAQHRQGSVMNAIASPRQIRAAARGGVPVRSLPLHGRRARGGKGCLRGAAAAANGHDGAPHTWSRTVRSLSRAAQQRRNDHGGRTRHRKGYRAAIVWDGNYLPGLSAPGSGARDMFRAAATARRRDLRHAQEPSYRLLARAAPSKAWIAATGPGAAFRCPHTKGVGAVSAGSRACSVPTHSPSASPLPLLPCWSTSAPRLPRSR